MSRPVRRGDWVLAFGVAAPEEFGRVTEQKVNEVTGGISYRLDPHSLALPDVPNDVNVDVWISLGLLRRVASRSDLSRFLSSQNPTTRQLAMRALGELGTGP